MLMKHSYPLFFLFLVAFSCSDDRKIAPDDPVAPRLTGLLKTVTIQSSSGEMKEEFTYYDSLALKSVRYTRNGQSAVETFDYEKDTLRNSRIGDTLKKYIYLKGKLRQIEKHVAGKPGSYTAVMFTYDSDGKANSIEERVFSSGGLSSSYIRDILIIWRGENIGMFRERLSSGLVEDHDFQYSESRNPYFRLYSEILRVPAENPYILSYNTLLHYSTFFAGKKFRVEGEYLARKLPLRETLLEFTSENGGEWKPVKQYTYEYYE